jgi:wyosine [tRNA(Phe)-imidazoG37] synthetase (radical SAM superfamily)
MSLGIDPVPLKTCNFNCVYCQLGRTRRPTTRRRTFFGVSRILAELAIVLDHRTEADIDWITLVGSGETTLCSGIGTLIRFIKGRTAIPVAVITNGSTLWDARVRTELSAADAVLPSLDAGTETLCRRINRPHSSFSFSDHVDGLALFRRSYRGKLWIEVMLIDGMNDSAAALHDIAGVLRAVEPDEIHLSTPTRPPAEPWVGLPDGEALERAEAILGRVAPVQRPSADDGEGGIDGDFADAVVAIVSRHPLRQLELERMLSRWTRARVDRTLEALTARGEIQRVERFGTTFWCAAGMEFPAPATAVSPPSSDHSTSAAGPT